MKIDAHVGSDVIIDVTCGAQWSFRDFHAAVAWPKFLTDVSASTHVCAMAR